MPERDFFFCIMCTLKNQDMKDVITSANEQRFKADEAGEKKDAIRLSDAWLEELMKHPHHSRKTKSLIVIGKAGTGVYLFRESAKVSKEIKERRMFKIAKQLGPEEENQVMAGHAAPDKLKKRPDGRPMQQNLGGARRMMIDPPQRQ